MVCIIVEWKAIETKSQDTVDLGWKFLGNWKGECECFYYRAASKVESLWWEGWGPRLTWIFGPNLHPSYRVRLTHRRPGAAHPSWLSSGTLVSCCWIHWKFCFFFNLSNKKRAIIFYHVASQEKLLWPVSLAIFIFNLWK